MIREIPTTGDGGRGGRIVSRAGPGRRDHGPATRASRRARDAGTDHTSPSRPAASRPSNPRAEQHAPALTMHSHRARATGAVRGPGSHPTPSADTAHTPQGIRSVGRGTGGRARGRGCPCGFEGLVWRLDESATGFSASAFWRVSWHLGTRGATPTDGRDKERLAKCKL